MFGSRSRVLITVPTKSTTQHLYMVHLYLSVFCKWGMEIELVNKSWTEISTQRFACQTAMTDLFYYMLFAVSVCINVIRAGMMQIFCCSNPPWGRVKKKQLVAKLILSIFRQPLHVTGVSRPIIRRYNRMYTTKGTYYSYKTTVCCPGWIWIAIRVQPAQQTVI